MFKNGDERMHASIFAAYIRHVCLVPLSTTKGDYMKNTKTNTKLIATATMLVMRS